MTTLTLEDELAAFTETTTWASLRTGGHDWRYATLGHGDEWVMVIHGGGGEARTMFRYAMHLATDFRVIVPTLPAAIDQVFDLTAGLADVLDHAGIGTTHVYGPSLGGWVAQAFAYDHPNRVGKCVFSHTSVPRPDVVGKLDAARRFIKVAPYGLFRRMFLRGMRRSLQTDVPDISDDEVRFWISMIEPRFTVDMDKSDVLAMMRLQIDFHRNADFSASALRREPDRFALIFHENDEDFDERARAEMKALYEQAELTVLPTYGHAGGLARQEVVVQTVREFLRRPVPPTDDRATGKDNT
ncbi:MAG: alpha/beta hydrolase [Actinomycetota bacterium]